MAGFNSFRDKIQKSKILVGIILKRPITGPYSVHIDLTNRCNNDCIACWSYSPLVKGKTMSKELMQKELPYKLVIKLIDDLAKTGAREIYFTGGGEPFMHPKIIDIMQYVKKKNMKCDMSTNLTLLTRKKIEKIVDAKVDHINCSIWAGSPKIYAKCHPNKNEKMFHQIKKSLMYFHEYKEKTGKKKPIITLYNVISSYNYKDILNMVESAYEVKAEAVEFTPADIVPRLTDKIILDKKQKKQALELIDKAVQKTKYFEKKYNHRLIFRNLATFRRRLSEDKNGLYDRSVIGKIPCYAGFNFLRILADGSVNSCLKSSRIPIGNIYEKDIKKIWYGKKQGNFRKHTIDYNIKDPFFHKIGNPGQKGNGCLYTCDNLGWNLIFDKEIKKIKFWKSKKIN